MTLKKYDTALASFKQLEDEYKESEKIAESFFLTAFIYENYLNNLPQAEKYYNIFLQKYPNHALAKYAKVSLNYLGKTPEELIKIFQNKDKKQL